MQLRRTLGIPYMTLWRLFTMVWPLYFIEGITYLQQTYMGSWHLGVTPGAMAVFLLSVGAMAVFVGLYFWLTWRNPFPETPPTAQQMRATLAILATMVLLVLTLCLGYRQPWAFMFIYVTTSAGVRLPIRLALWIVALVTLLTVIMGLIITGNWLAAGLGALPVGALGLGVIGGAGGIATFRELQRAREEIARLAVADERVRFARDLHDLLGHSLSLITLKSELAGRLVTHDANRAAVEIQDVERVARDALQQVRAAVLGYRQPTLHSELAGVQRMLAAAGIVANIDIPVDALPATIDATLAWVVREGATNIIRHSHAQHCSIAIVADWSHVRCDINDDGCGGQNTMSSFTNGNGLIGLAERIEVQNGIIEAGPRSDTVGFRLHIELPLGLQSAIES